MYVYVYMFTLIKMHVIFIFESCFIVLYITDDEIKGGGGAFKIFLYDNYVFGNQTSIDLFWLSCLIVKIVNHDNNFWERI